MRPTSMPKSLIRIVSVSISACLLVDPAFASSFTHQALNPPRNGIQAQALNMNATMFRNSLVDPKYGAAVKHGLSSEPPASNVPFTLSIKRLLLFLGLTLPLTVGFTEGSLP